MRVLNELPFFTILLRAPLLRAPTIRCGTTTSNMWNKLNFAALKRSAHVPTQQELAFDAMSGRFRACLAS